MPRRERSRSPHGEVALALPASSSDTLPRSFDLNKMELTLDGNVVNMYHFADEPDMPWFQAKPIMTFLGYSNITVTLNRLEQDERNTLKDLMLVDTCLQSSPTAEQIRRWLEEEACLESLVKWRLLRAARSERLSAEDSDLSTPAKVVKTAAKRQARN